MISTHPRTGTVTFDGFAISLSTPQDFNSPPRGDGNTSPACVLPCETISTHPRAGTVTDRRPDGGVPYGFQLTPARGHVAQTAEFILRRGGCRIGMHIEKTAELRTAGAVRLRGDFGIISQLCGLRARQVRADRAVERLHDRDFCGRNFNSPPRGDGNTLYEQS